MVVTIFAVMAGFSAAAPVFIISQLCGLSSFATDRLTLAAFAAGALISAPYIATIVGA